MSGFGSWPELLNRPQFAILTSSKYHFLYSAFQRKSEFCINVLTDIVSDLLTTL
jgi:flavin reductase (DIM6/NTAB) family NADH-FMN oxidoreductase RutF